MRITLEELLSVVKGKWNGVKIASFSNFALDSRKISKGGLFFALKGEKTDGHLFVKNAYENGAAGAVVEEDISFFADDFLTIKTNSVKGALIKLGRYARNKLNGRIIGVSGSAGKTTTKEMLSEVLETHFAIYKTEGNANTELSLPLFFLNAERLKTDFCIVEMGVQKLGDMDILNRIVNPDIALLLNATVSHTEFLKSVENVAKEKFKLAVFVNSKGGSVFLNGDDKNFVELALNLKKKPLFFGLSSKNDVSARIKKILVSGMELEIKNGTNVYTANFPFSGVNFAYDVLAAVSVANSLGIDTKEALNVLSRFRPLNGRGGETKLSKNRLLIDETYNSNPLSLEYSLSRFKEHQYPLFIILGDMLELGEYSEEAHGKIGKIIAYFKPDFVLAVGRYSKFTIEETYKRGVKNAFYFPKKEDLCDFLKNEIAIPPFSVIFVKGSRGMEMEQCVKILKERFKE